MANKMTGTSDMKIQPVRIQVRTMMNKADLNRRFITFSSDIKNVGYIGCTDDGLLIISQDNGYLRIDWNDLDLFVEELTEYVDQLKLRKRAEA